MNLRPNFHTTIYYHFTTIGAETGSFRVVRTVFSERKIIAERGENFVCKFTTQAEGVARTPRSAAKYFANLYYLLIFGLFGICINILKNT